MTFSWSFDLVAYFSYVARALFRYIFENWPVKFGNPRTDPGAKAVYKRRCWALVTNQEDKKESSINRMREMALFDDSTFGLIEEVIRM
jgi:hypothetical protein